MQRESPLLILMNRINFNCSIKFNGTVKDQRMHPNFVLEVASRRRHSAQRKHALIIHCTAYLCSENSLDLRGMKWLIPVYTIAFDFSNETNFVESKSTVYDFYCTLRNKQCSFTPSRDAIARTSSPIDLKV